MLSDLFAVEFKKVERTECGRGFAAISANQVKDGKAVVVANDSPRPSMRQERNGSLPTAIAIKGKRPEKSFPARVISRTPVASFRARIRKPSCLISWIQPGPEGGTLAGAGRHGSITPNRGRARSRNDMGD
jgi:hypothetical protein